MIVSDAVSQSAGLPKQIHGGSIPPVYSPPVVLWLAREDSKVSGKALTTQGLLIPRIFLAETAGLRGHSNLRNA